MKLKILFLISLFVIALLENNNAVLLKFTNIVCRSLNESWYVVNTCRLRAVSRYRTELFFNATILHSVSDIFMRVRMLKKANGYKPWIVNVALDACRFMKYRCNPTANFLASFVEEFTNINHTCPYVGDLIISGLYLSTEKFQKLPFPTGDYMMSINGYFYKKLQYEVNASFSFVDDLIKQ